MKPHLESVRASASRKLLTAFLAVQMVALNFSPAWAAGYNLPSPKDAAYSLSDGDTKMTITPSAERSTIHYNYFDIQNGYKVEFADSPASVTINKVEGGGRSEIFGVLDAQGKIYLLNSSGVLFGDGAHVNVGGLVASTFMDVEPNEAGQLVFQGAPGTGDITVQGGATINAGAFAYLVGKNVNLAGAVNAGEVLVAAFGDRQSDYDAGSIVLKLGSDNPNADGGDIDITGSFTNATSISELTGDSVAITNITLYAVKDISQIGDDSAWRADAPITLTAIGTVGITLANTGNAFSGPVSATAADSEATITLTAAGALELAAVTAGSNVFARSDGDLSLTGAVTAERGELLLNSSSGAVTGTDAGAITVSAGKANIQGDTGILLAGPVKVTGDSTLTAAASGNIVLTNAANDFGGAVTAKAESGNITLQTANALLLDEVTAGGNLDLRAHGGGITQQSGGFVSVVGTSTLGAEDAGDIVLYNGANDFGGDVTAWTAVGSGGEIKLQSVGNLTLADVLADGKVTATAATNLTAGKVMSINKGVSLTAAGGSVATLGAEDDIIRADHGRVEVTSQGDLAVNKINAGSDGLMLASTAGSVTGTGAIDVKGESTLKAAGNIVLTNAANDFTGTVTATATGGSVTLKDKNALTMGAVTAGGDASFTAGGDLTLSEQVNADGNLTAIATDGTFTTAHDLEAGKSVTVESGNGNLELANVTARDGDVSATASGNLALTGTVSVTNGSLTAIASNGTFSTTQDLAAGKNITIESGSGDISLPKVNAGSNLTVTAAGGSIGQGSGTVIKAKGTTVLTAGGDYIALENDENDFVGTVTATATNGWIHLRDANDLTAGDVKAKGNVTLAAQTNLTLKGAVEGGPVVDLKAKNGNLKGEETASIKGGSNLYVYAYGEGAEVVLPETVVGTDGSGYMLVRTPNGTIRQLADTAVTVDGNTVLEAGGNIMLDNTGNDFGAVAAEGLAVTLTDKNGIALGADLPLLGKYNVTATDLTVTAKDGNITQTEGTTVTATGTTELEAAGNILLNSTWNDFATVSSATAGGDVKLADANDLTVGDLTSGGEANVYVLNDLTVGNVEAKDINLEARTNLTVTGAVHGDTSNKVIVFASQGMLTVEEAASVRNDTGDVSLYGKSGIVFDGQVEGSSVLFDASGGTSGALTSGENAHATARDDYVWVWTRGDMDLPAIDAGRLGGTVYTNGNITQSGAIHTTTTNRSVDLTTFDGSITLTNADNSISGETGFYVTGGDLDVYSKGDLTVDVARVENDATLTAEGVLTTDYAEVGGAATLAAGNDIALTGKTSVTNGLTATAGGNITQTGDQALTVGGTTELTATAGNIVLTNAANAFEGAVTAHGGAVSLADKDAIELGWVEATDLSVTAAAGAITQSGAVTATGATTLTATDAVTLDNENNDFGGAVRAEGTEVTLRDANDLLLGDVTATTGDVTATAGGSVTNTGAVVSEKGDITFTAGSDIGVQGTLTAELGTVTLQAEDDVSVAAAVTAENVSVHAGGNYTGTGTVTATQDLEIEIGGDMTVSNAMSANRNLKLAAGTNLTLEAAVEARTGTIELMAHEGDLTSTTAGTVTAKTNAVLGAGGNMVLDGAVEAGTNVTMTAGGDMTLGGAVKAGSNVTAMADGTVSINGDLDAGGNLKADAAGIEQGGSGAVTVAGTATLTARDGNANLGNEGNDFKGLVTATATNGSITLRDKNTIDTGKLDATDAVTVTAKNDVTLTDEVTAGGNIEVTSTEGSITNRAPVESTGGNITFTARQDIGVDSGLTATAGTIKLWATNDVAVRAPVTAEGVDVYAGGNYMGDGLVTATMDLYMRVGGDLTLAESLIAARNLTVSAGTNLTLNASVEGRTGNVELTARAGDLKSNGAGTVTAGTNAVLQAGGDMELGGTVTASNAVTATAASNLTASAAIATEKGNVALTATNGKLETADKIDAGRNATLKAGGDMTLGSTVDADGNVLAQGGGDLTANQAITAGTNATLTATGSVAVNESVTATAGYVHAIATNGTLTVASGKTVHGGTDVTLRAVTGNATVGGKVEAGRNATLYAGGTLAAEGDVEAESNAVFTSGTDMTVAGNVRAGNAVTNRAVGTYTNTGTITAEAGNVAITGAKGATVSNAVEATAGDVSVATSASGALLHVAATGSVTAGHDAELTAKKGSVTLDGAVSATNDATVKAGTGGNLTTTAGGKIDAGHDAVLESAKATILDGTVTAGNSVTATAGTSMDVNADVTATAGDATLKANGGKLATTSSIVAGKTADLYSKGDMKLQGAVGAGDEVKADTKGYFETTDQGPITATNGAVTVTAATNVTFGAAVESKMAGVNATATAGKLTTTSDGKIDAAADVVFQAKTEMALDGTVTAGKNATLTAETGDMTLNAAVTAVTNDVTAQTGGSFTSTDTVKASAGDVTITAKENATFSAAVEATQGTVTAIATNGTLEVSSGGSVTAGTDAELTAVNGDIKLDGAVGAGSNVTATAGTSMDVNAAVAANGGKADLKANGGALTTTGNGTVHAATDVVMYSSGDTLVQGAVDAGSNVTATADGAFANTAKITAAKGDVDITAKTGATVSNAVEATVANVTVTADNGNIDSYAAGTITAGSNVLLTASAGGVTLRGAVGAGSNVTVKAEGGSFENTGNGSITATNGIVEITANQNVKLDAAVTAVASNVLVKADHGTLTSTANGTVDAGTDATLESDTAMELNGTVTAGSNVTATAGTSLDVNAAVAANGGKADLKANSGALTTTGNGTVHAATDVVMYSSGDTLVQGAVDAGSNVTATAGGSFTNKASGSMTAATGDVKVLATDIVYLDAGLTATTSNVTVTAQNGTLTSTEKGTIGAKGDVELTSKKDMTLEGAVAAGGNATLRSTSGSFTNMTTGRVTATNGTVLIDSAKAVSVNAAVESKQGNVTIQARDGSLTNSAAGTITAKTDTLLESSSNMALEGAVLAGNTATNKAGGTFGNTGSGTVTATAGNVLIDAGSDIRLDAPVEATAASVTVTNAAGTFTNTTYGTVTAGENVGISASGAAVVEGNIDGGKYVTVISRADSVTVDGAKVSAGEDLVMLAEQGALTWRNGATVGAGSNMVLKAKQDVTLTKAVLGADNVGVQSYEGDINVDADSTMVGTNMLVLVANDSVTIQGGVETTTLGIKSGGDITMDNVTADEFAAESTNGSVTVTFAAPVNLTSLHGGTNSTAQVTAMRADGLEATVQGVLEEGDTIDGIVAAQNATVNGGQNVSGLQIVAGGQATLNVGALAVGSVNAGGTATINAGSVNSSTIHAGSDVVATVGGPMSVGTLTAGHDIVLESVGGDFTATTASAGNALDANVGGGFTVETLDVGGTMDATVGGGAEVQTLTTGGSLNADIGGAATLKKADIGGDATIKSGGALTFDSMEADDVKVNSASINMGKLNAGNAELAARGSINDNGSLVRVRNLTMTAGGDIGSAGKPINTEISSRIERIAGKNIYLHEQSTGHDILLGTIDASGHLSLSAPRIGLPDGLHGYLDANGDSLNLIAGSGLELDLGGRMGTAGDPMEAQVNGKWTILNGELEGTPMSYIYIVMGDTEYSDTPAYIGTIAIPGLVIVNGRPVLGHPDLLRKIYSALAFSVDTPELKSTQGIFGSPLFLHTDLALFNAGETGVDYWNVIQNDLLDPNNGKNAVVYGPRRWGLDDSLWDSERMSRSRLYLIEFEPLPEAKEAAKPAPKASAKDSAAKPAAKASPAEKTSDKASAKPAAKEAASKPASSAKAAAAKAPAKPAAKSAAPKAKAGEKAE